MATNYVLDPALVQEIVNAKDELKAQADRSVPLVDALESYVNQQSSGTVGVSSFKGRTGAVEPTQDDYSYNQLRDLPAIPQTTNQLNDVTLNNPEDKQALIWNESTQQWVNKTIDYNDLVNKPATGDLLARADCYTILGSDVTFTQDSVDKTVNFGSCAINQKEVFNTETYEFVAKDTGTYKVILSLDSDDTPLSQAGSVVGFTYKLVKYNGTAWADALDNASQPIKIECIDNVVIGKKFIISYISVAIGDRYKVVADVNSVGDSIVVKADSGVVMFQPLPPDYKSSWGEAGFYGYFFTTGTASGVSGGDGITTEEATVLFENLWGAKTPADLGAQPEDSDLTAIAGLVGNGLLKRDSGGVWSFDTNTYLNQTTANTLYAPALHVGTGGTAHAVATTSVNGFMSSTDKTKLNGVAAGANNYVHPTSGAVAGTYKSITVDVNGHVTKGTNPTTLAGYGITDAAPSTHVGSTGSAHGVATTSVNGFMSAADKTKLDGLGGTSLSPTSGTMTPTVEGLKTAGTWSPAGSNIVEWVKVDKVVTFNVIVNGTLTGSSGAMNIRLPAISSWGAFTNNTSYIEIPCQRFDGFTTEVKGLVSATPQWSGEYNYFSMHTQANTSPWARSNLTAPSGAFTLAFSGSVILK